MTTRTTTAARKAGQPARSPAAAKKPADRKPPAPKVKTVDGGRQVTIEGLTMTIADEAVDDFELMDLMGQAERNQDPTLLPELLRRFVGEGGYREVMDHLRDAKTGRVPVEGAVDFVNKLVEALDPNS